MSTKEIDLIRRLVATLSDLEAEYSEILHHRAFANEACDCPLCDGRQYLKWREDFDVSGEN